MISKGKLLHNESILYYISSHYFHNFSKRLSNFELDFLHLELESNSLDIA